MGEIFMTIKTVKNQSELLAALKVAKGGDTIKLADGHYGAVTLTQKFGSEVTLEAVHSGKAVFDSLTVKGGANLSIEGITATTEFRAWFGAKAISVDEVKTAAFYFRDVDGLTLDHSEAANGYSTLILNDVRNFAIRNSTFKNAVEDVARLTGNSYNGVFESNVFSDTNAKAPLHPDLLQIFNVGAESPHDITIRGNLFYDDQKTGSVNAQGIFLGGPGANGFSNFLIEHNMIAVRSPNSIYINGGQENVIVRNNTLMGYDSSNGGVIRLAEKSGFDNSGTTVYNNIAKALVDETRKSEIGDNYLYGKTVSSEDVFHGATGSTWDDFLPRNIHVAFGYGASGWVQGQNRDAGAIIQENTLPASALSLQMPSIREVYDLDGKSNFSGNLDSRVIRTAHDASLEIDEGTIAFNFNSDTTGWRRGFVSKDAAGTGDHFGVWLENGTLKIKFGDESREEILSVAGVKAKTDYSFVASFDDDHARAWLNGKLVGEVAIDMDWRNNHETLMIGADNSASAKGTTGAARYAYDGIISDLTIHDTAMTPAELAAHLAGGTMA